MEVIRKSLIIPLYERYKKNSASKYKKLVTQSLTLDRDTLVEKQNQKFVSTVQRAFNEIPFYKTHYQEMSSIIGEGDYHNIVKTLPTISKSDIQGQNSSFLNPSFAQNALIQSSTGGTTSSPTSFFLDPTARSKRIACTRFFSKWYGHEPGDRIAFLWGATQDFPQSPSRKLGLLNYLTYQSLMLPSSYLNDQSMGNFYNQLRVFKPVLLQAYSNPLYCFAKFLEKEGLNLEIPNITATAEPLHHHQREVIERVFKKKIFLWYGAREIGHAASECSKHQGLHQNTFGLMFEVQLPNGDISKEGQGNLVLTDLQNPCMPLIRYQIGDVGTLSNRICECGSPLPFLEIISGRITDVFVNRDGTMIPGVSFTGRIIESDRFFKEIQIIQNDYEFITLNIVKNSQFNIQALEKLKADISTYFRCELQFKINYLDQIPREKSGKIRFCISNVRGR